MKEFFSEDIIEYFEEKSKKNCNYAALFEDIEKKFRKNDICKLLNYIFKEKHDYSLLNVVIRKANKYKFVQNINALIDFILIQNQSQEFANLKVLAIKTISGYKDKNAVAALLFCLNDKNSNYKVRLAAAEALGKIGDRAAYESLINVVCDDKEKSTYVKESAVTALGMLGDNRALDVFDSIINAKQMFLDKFIFLKEKIIEAMSKFDATKDKKALNILKKALLDSSSKIRISAIEAIMNLDIDESYEIIYECMKYDSDIEVKKNALVALYNLSDRRILDEVAKGSYEDELREYANYLIKVYEADND